MVNRPTLQRRLLGAAAGLLADRACGEPPRRLHPVAGFGTVMGRVERAIYADSRRPGVAYAATGTLLGAAAGYAVPSTAAAVAVTAAGHMLRSCALDIGRLLTVGDLPGARAALPGLVGRDTECLDESGVAAAVVESLAENTVDAVVAPALWGATLGAPGAAAYRAINTMDAMVGHHSPRYERFGWASARLDDVAGYLPARMAVLLVCLARPRRTRVVLDTVRRDAPAHRSPNAGVAEAAFAAALGLQLGGPLRYDTRHEDRPLLGCGPRPCAADIARAVRLASHTELALVALLATFGVALGGARRDVTR
jgi:adenosylcobinamide-phosphate synthase